MVNFRIIENAPILNDIEGFKKDYLDSSYTLRDLGRKYDISYTKIKTLVKNLGLPPRKGGTRNPKYYCYSKSHKKWVINKVIDGESYYFGSYGSEDEVKRVVEYLKRNDWSEESVNRVRVEKNNRKVK